ncbi:TolC family protein, partial [bacterium]
KGEATAISGLRFLTGVQGALAVADEPIKRPDVPLGALAQYLTSARLFRPEANMARAGVFARKSWADFQRARLFPDIAIGGSVGYSTAPGVIQQNNPWVIDPFNRFGYGFALNMRWNLDLLPQAARVAQADAQHEETRAQQRFSLAGVAAEVETSYASVVEARTREEAWDRAERRARRWLVMVQDAIDVGAQDERALTEPLQTYANTRGSHLQALFDLNVAQSHLAMVSGWDAAAPQGK